MVIYIRLVTLKKYILTRYINSRPPPSPKPFPKHSLLHSSQLATGVEGEARGGVKESKGSAWWRSYAPEICGDEVCVMRYYTPCASFHPSKPADNHLMYGIGKNCCKTRTGEAVSAGYIIQELRGSYTVLK
jgi:hypothetical protein